MEGLKRTSTLATLCTLLAAWPLAGCSPLHIKVPHLFGGQDKTAYDAVLLCRTKVLMMQDGRPVPGVVAQVYLVGGPEFVPVPAPEGRFRFVAYDARQPTQPLQKWEFSAEETPRHRIDHTLGPCYAFWLPVNVPAGMRLPLVVQCAFETRTGQIISSPVKLILPGAVDAPLLGINHPSRQPPPARSVGALSQPQPQPQLQPRLRPPAANSSPMGSAEHGSVLSAQANQ